MLEDYSYFPFGLQQKGIGLTASGPLHNYKNTFQKQELNEDLGVDVYEFKYRMDDPQIGRFWQIDPLADKCVYNSTYAFSENHLTGHIELEGLEKISIKDVFNSPSLAIDYLLQPEVYVDAVRTFNDLVGVNSAIELFTGKSSESGFTEDKPRVNAAIELSMVFVGPEFKAEGAALKIGTSDIVSKVAEKIYQTYTKKNSITGEVYSGGPGGKVAAYKNLETRDAGHHLKKKDGWEPSKLDNSSTSREAIRGRELQLIERNGGVKSMGGTSCNKIYGISPNNPNKEKYIKTAESFGWY